VALLAFLAGCATVDDGHAGHSHDSKKVYGSNNAKKIYGGQIYGHCR
jgi:hypothetical protein